MFTAGNTKIGDISLGRLMHNRYSWHVVVLWPVRHNERLVQIGTGGQCMLVHIRVHKCLLLLCLGTQVLHLLYMEVAYRAFMITNK